MDDYHLPHDQNLDPEAARRDAVIARRGAELLASRSPKQRQLADAVYEQLLAGAEVEDIEHLIADLGRTARADTRSARPRNSAGGRW